MSDTNDRMKRRDYLQTTAASAILLALGPASEAVAKDKGPVPTPSASTSPTASPLFLCDACGHVEFGGAPEFCPVCNTEERFRRNDTIFADATAKLKGGSTRHTPVIHVNGKSELVPDVPCKEVRVRVGEVMHEVEKANHIHFIDFYLDGHFFTRFFASPQMEPAVVLFVRPKAARIRAVAYCSQHGFWQAEMALS